ncbi:MAG TPA: hypothetical protein VLA24_12940 [Pseudomonadales bacterium]|nr:hypothetical protein [Pseudomonadales bacterium]
MALVVADSPNVSVDFTAYQGDTFVRSMSLQTNTNGVVTGINVAGYFVAATIKRVRGGTVQTLHESNTVNGGIVISGSASNVITWTMNTTVTNTLPSGSMVYDLRLSNATVRSTYLTGQFIIEREVRE